MKPNHCFALAGFGAAVAGAAWFGSRYSPKDPRTRLWYSRLDKPSYNPPNYISHRLEQPLYAHGDLGVESVAGGRLSGAFESTAVMGRSTGV